MPKRERATARMEVHLTPSELAALKRVAGHEGYVPTKWLVAMVRCGMGVSWLENAQRTATSGLNQGDLLPRSRQTAARPASPSSVASAAHRKVLDAESIRIPASRANPIPP